MSREDTIKGLRMLADYLEARPDVPAPYVGAVNAFAEGTELPMVAKAMGGFTKRSMAGYLVLRKDFTKSVRLEVNFESEAVCEKVVVGSEDVPEKVVPAYTREIVEWQCPESILGMANGGA